MSKLKGLRGYGDLAEDESGRVMIAENMDLNENTDVPINKLVKPLLDSDVTITDTKSSVSSTAVKKSCVFKPSRGCWLHLQNKIIVESDPGTGVLTPTNAPFLLYNEDLKTLELSAFILGQVLDALFIIIYGDLLKFGIKVFILPQSFFTLIHSDSSLHSPSLH